MFCDVVVADVLGVQNDHNTFCEFQTSTIVESGFCEFRIHRIVGVFNWKSMFCDTNTSTILAFLI